MCPFVTDFSFFLIFHSIMFPYMSLPSLIRKTDFKWHVQILPYFIKRRNSNQSITHHLVPKCPINCCSLYHSLLMHSKFTSYMTNLFNFYESMLSTPTNVQLVQKLCDLLPTDLIYFLWLKLEWMRKDRMFQKIMLGIQ